VPLTTGYGKLVLAEFDYDLQPAPSFPFDTTKERWSMYQFKRYALPELSWSGRPEGLAQPDQGEASRRRGQRPGGMLDTTPSDPYHARSTQ